MMDSVELTACKRIRIIGAPGSGKTHVAAQLSEALGLQVANLDNPLLPLVDPDATWIVEGTQLWHNGTVLEHADLIIWLDLPRSVCQRRIMTRQLSSAQRAEHSLAGQLTALRRYFSSEPREPVGPDDWESITRAETELTLARFAERVMHLRTTGDVKGLLALADAAHA